MIDWASTVRPCSGIEMDWIIIFSVTFTLAPLQTTLFFNLRTTMWLIWSHNLLRRSKLHYKQGQSTFWNNKISIIIFNPPRCYTTRQIALFIYFPLVLLQINSFGFHSHYRELMLHSPLPSLSWADLGSVCLRDCHAWDRGDNLTPQTLPHNALGSGSCRCDHGIGPSGSN